MKKKKEKKIWWWINNIYLEFSVSVWVWLGWRIWRLTRSLTIRTGILRRSHRTPLVWTHLLRWHILSSRHRWARVSMRWIRWISLRRWTYHRAGWVIWPDHGTLWGILVIPEKPIIFVNYYIIFCFACIELKKSIQSLIFSHETKVNLNFKFQT